MTGPTLRQWQDAFVRYLLAGDNEAVLAAWVGGRRIPAGQRLEVYRHAYYIRLEEALARDFPLLRAVLGDATFGREMAAYVRARPSRSPTIRDLGRALPAWFEARHATPLADLCRLEWALVQAFDAPDAPILDGEALLRRPPEAWADLRLALHPSVSLLRVTSDVLASWTAFRRGEEVPGPEPCDAHRLLVWRRDGASRVQAIPPEQGIGKGWLSEVGARPRAGTVPRAG